MAEADPVHGAGPMAEADSAKHEVARLAVAVRRISEVVLGHPIGSETVSRATLALEEIADDLEQAAGEGRPPGFRPDLAGAMPEVLPTSPIFGPLSPISPPAEAWAVQTDDGPELRGRVRFGYPFEGPPTCVHGGVLAELFDEMLGGVNVISGVPGVTGTLTVRYRAPTPLLTELDLVGRLLGIEGRKIRNWAGIYHQGTLTAEAEGLFLAVGPAKMQAIQSANREAADPTGSRSA